MTCTSSSQSKLTAVDSVKTFSNGQQFIMKLARTPMTLGAPSHRIESQLVAGAPILEVDAEFIYLPNIFLVVRGPGDVPPRSTSSSSLVALHSET